MRQFINKCESVQKAYPNNDAITLLIEQWFDEDPEESLLIDRTEILDILLKYKSSSSKTITYLEVAFADKDYVKRYGARWNPDFKKWFYMGTVPDELVPFITKQPKKSSPILN